MTPPYPIGCSGVIIVVFEVIMVALCVVRASVALFILRFHEIPFCELNLWFFKICLLYFRVEDRKWRGLRTEAE